MNGLLPRHPAPAAQRRIRPALFFLLLILALGGLLLHGRGPRATAEAHTTAAPAQPLPPPPSIREKVVSGEFSNGDTITGLLGHYLSPAEIQQLAAASRKVFPLSGIGAGEPYRIRLRDGAFDGLSFDIDRDDQLLVSKSPAGFQVSREPIPYTVTTALVQGRISSSLFESVEQIGESSELAMALADIFGWDIDFIRDLRTGDSYRVVLEKRFRDGTPAGYGRILAAQFTNQGQAYQAFLYDDGSGHPAYYDAAGNSLRKAFLKAPLAFTRISSGYSMHRFHPITKTWKAHPAIDYAAPVGTPIKTVGDGTIYDIGYNRFNGNYIKIRHSNGYISIYLHMSRFARGMKDHLRVSQGEVIGYVGATGLATGPHLCFRMRKNGQPINPTKLKSAAAAPIPKDRRAAFSEAIRPLLARLENGGVMTAQLAPGTQSAQASSGPAEGEN